MSIKSKVKSVYKKVTGATGEKNYLSKESQRRMVGKPDFTQGSQKFRAPRRMGAITQKEVAALKKTAVRMSPPKFKKKTDPYDPSRPRGTWNSRLGQGPMGVLGSLKRKKKTY